MRIAIACDHAGYPLKEVLKAFLTERGHEVLDFGTDSEESVDYPDFAHPLAGRVERGEVRRGVLLCGTGLGMSYAANRHAGVRAAVAWSVEVAQLSREHNDSNVLVLPARFVTDAEGLEIVHDAGGLLYYDGANLNAILGKVRPGDMGFDVIHMNLHKTFSTPHGGGGPGAGAVGVGARLLPFMPIPVVGKEGDKYRWLTEKDLPQSIGRLSAFMGNAGVLLRAYIYMRMLGREGMHRVGEFATLNANYLMARLAKAGFDPAYPNRRASHEFIITAKKQARDLGVTAMDFAKRLLDYGFHAPTTYFPLLVPECLLIEPTETESKEALDGFIDAMIAIQKEAESQAEFVKSAPHTMTVRRLDDVRAARQLDLTWKPAAA